MENTVLELHNISKSFPGVKALDNISLKLQQGEVRGLVGENGAGKSTLMKILTGVYAKDQGQILIDGEEVKIQSPLEAQKLGLSIIFQEFNLVNTLSIAENIFVGRLPYRGVGISWKRITRQADELLAQVGLHVDSRTKVSQLSVAGKQMVEIAKALSFHSKIIIMDEPSATLTSKELENLFSIIRNLKAQGITVIYISHRLDEIFELCDNVTVMRDGAVIDTKPIGELTRSQIISLMIGREMGEEYPARECAATEEVVLKAEHLTREGAFEDISFQLHKGEILGLAGLVGAGRTEIVRAIFGADKLTCGSVYCGDKLMKINSPVDAIAAGIGLATEDRKTQGLALDVSVAANTTLAAIKKMTRFSFLNRQEEKKVAQKYVDILRTKTPSVQTRVGGLSGGNQQKVVLAKWLYCDADILILDEPTRGIDVGAKYEIYQLMNRLVKEGKSIILISSEMPEVTNMSDRILVIHEGRLKAELTGADRTPDMVLKNAILKEGQQ